MERLFNVRGKPVSVALDEKGDRVHVTVDGKTLEIEGVAIDDRYVTFRAGARFVRVPFARAGAHVHASIGGESYEFVPAEEIEESGRGADAFVPEITSPMPGKVLAVKVAVGDVVEADQPLLLLEAMKMEQTVRAPARARVAEIRVQDGAMVGPGAVLMRLEEAGE
jgi:3-methylcrotonyl-CoA carboxylase alpha subunit